MLSLDENTRPAQPGRPSGQEATGQATASEVGPSRTVRLVLRPLTKVLNPAIVRLAGRQRVKMAAQVRHVGRTSGRHYVTPVSARRADDTIVIPLTFGSRSDWSRNVRAAGSCVIRLGGAEYQAVRPRLADSALASREIAAAFNGRERLMFRMLGIKRFLLLDVA